jgi:hypothetical protein
MARGSMAPLSANEETTLRRVALGVSDRVTLSQSDVERFELLALVEETDGVLRLTSRGRERYVALPKSIPSDGSGSSEDLATRLQSSCPSCGSSLPVPLRRRPPVRLICEARDWGLPSTR